MAGALSLVLSEVYRSCYTELKPTLIVPVPAHKQKMRRRGYNQVILIADGLARSTNIELDRFSLVKTMDTRAQVGLTAEERLANVRGAYAVRRPERVYGRRILLVDDVSTTGATLRETASALRDAGAQGVYALAVAHRTLQMASPETNEGNTFPLDAVTSNNTDI